MSLSLTHTNLNHRSLLQKSVSFKGSFAKETYHFKGSFAKETYHFLQKRPMIVYVSVSPSLTHTNSRTLSVLCAISLSRTPIDTHPHTHCNTLPHTHCNTHPHTHCNNLHEAIHYARNTTYTNITLLSLTHTHMHSPSLSLSCFRKHTH